MITIEILNSKIEGKENIKRFLHIHNYVKNYVNDEFIIKYLIEYHTINENKDIAYINFSNGYLTINNNLTIFIDSNGEIDTKKSEESTKYNMFDYVNELNKEELGDLFIIKYFKYLDTEGVFDSEQPDYI